MNKRILVVEDNEKNRVLIRDVLKYHGYEVTEAANGREGIAAVKEQMPDLILMDIQMPVMDGFSTIKVLKDDPATRDIKVIALTSFAMKGDREKILAAGFSDYMAKPIDTRELPRFVEKLLCGER